MGAFARVQRRLLGAGGTRVSVGRALSVTYAGNALSSTLPVGPAVSVAFSFRQFRRWGASPQLASAVVALGGVVMTTAYTVVGLVALLAQPASRTSAVVGLGLLAATIGAAAVLWRWSAVRGPARRLIRPALRHRTAGPLIAQLREGRGTLVLGAGGWATVTTFALLNWLFDIVSLAAAGYAVGVRVPLYAVALAYFAAQAAGSLMPLLPGGLGAIEGSMAASLTAFGAAAVPAGAAVAVYRLASFWAVVGIGWLAWLALKSTEDGRHRLRIALNNIGASMYALTPYAPPPPPTPEPAKTR